MKKPNIFQILTPIMCLFWALGACLWTVTFYQADQYGLSLFYGVVFIGSLSLATLFGVPLLLLLHSNKIKPIDTNDMRELGISQEEE